MSNLTNALLGGVKGMAKATGEIYDDKIENKNYDRKQQILEKRQRTLASFTHGLALERDQINATNASGVRAENRTNVELDQDSGKMLDGQKLSNLQLSQLSDEDLGRTISVGSYKEGEDARKFGEKKELADIRIQGQKDIYANYGKTGIKAPKEPSAAKIKLIRENAINDIQALTAVFDPTVIDNTIEIDSTNLTPEDIKDLKSKVKSKGFNPTFIDKDGIFTINLGGFDYKKMSKAIAKPKDDRAKTSFDALYDALLNTPGSKMNPEQGAFQLKSSHGLAAPKQYPVDNSQR